MQAYTVELEAELEMLKEENARLRKERVQSTLSLSLSLSLSPHTHIYIILWMEGYKQEIYLSWTGPGRRGGEEEKKGMHFFFRSVETKRYAYNPDSLKSPP